MDLPSSVDWLLALSFTGQERAEKQDQVDEDDF